MQEGFRFVNEHDRVGAGDDGEHHADEAPHAVALLAEKRQGPELFEIRGVDRRDRGRFCPALLGPTIATTPVGGIGTLVPPLNVRARRRTSRDMYR
jgi:hypothetical protein